MIVFTDIHGNFDTFKRLYDSIPQSEKDEGVAIAGDLIDRGPKSMQMVQWCIDHPEVDVATGNHEQMTVNFAIKNAEHFIKHGLYHPGDHKDYSSSYGMYGGGYKIVNMYEKNGGFETLDSYIKYKPGEPDGEPVPEFDIETLKRHIEWMKTLPLYLEYKDVKNNKGEFLLVTHSSASKVWKWDDQRRKDMRCEFIDHLVWGRPNNIKPIDGVFNIFGHTPIKDGPRIKDCYANIDTGCFYDGSGFGKLTAIHFPSMKVYEQENIDGFWKQF